MRRKKSTRCGVVMRRRYSQMSADNAIEMRSDIQTRGIHRTEKQHRRHLDLAFTSSMHDIFLLTLRYSI